MGMTVEKNGSQGTETYGPFMRKAVRVEAYRFNNYAGSRGDRPRWLLEAIERNDVFFNGEQCPYLVVNSCGSWTQAEIGDWIVQDLSGAISVCAPEIFKRDFERVTAGSAQGPAMRAERDEAERAYIALAFNHVEAPIGSRDWDLFWHGWKIRAALSQQGDAGD